KSILGRPGRRRRARIPEPMPEVLMFAPRNTAIQTAEVYPPEGFASIERALRRLSPVLARAASETAQAFFPEQEGSGPDREAQALSGSGTLRCSQANIGES